jgi:hypothetical protein
MAVARAQGVLFDMAAPVTRLEVRFGTVEQLVQEYVSRLSKGIVVAGCAQTLRVGDWCDVTLVHPSTGHMLPLRVRVTSTNMAQRIVCQFEEFSPAIDAAIRDFVDLRPDRDASYEIPPQTDEEIRADGYVVDGDEGALWEDDGEGVERERDAEGGSDLDGIDVSELDGADRVDASGPGDAEGFDASELGYIDDAAAMEEGGEAGDGGADPLLLRTGIPANVHERLRHLKAHEIFKIARTGQLGERVALERIYGKTVWEPLLQNPNLTPPEVARISRMGTLPKPLIDVIVSHAGWLSKSLVRRALLSNPRLDGKALVKVLRALPKNELVQVPVQSAYPHKVREVAKRLLGR